MHQEREFKILVSDCQLTERLSGSNITVALHLPTIDPFVPINPFGPGLPGGP